MKKLDDTAKVYLTGAMDLKKACYSILQQTEVAQLETNRDSHVEVSNGVSSPIILERRGDVLIIAKKSGYTINADIEFQFKCRIRFRDHKMEWWPISFFDQSSGRTVIAESNIGTKVLTNVQKQNELIDLANTWAKSITSQSLIRSIKGIL